MATDFHSTALQKLTGDASPETAPILINLGDVFRTAGMLEEADKIFGVCLSICRSVDLSVCRSV